MRSAWQDESGQLACQWSRAWQRVEQAPQWLLEIAEMPSGYLPPVTDFASHGPFGGPSWFDRRSRSPQSE